MSAVASEAPLLPPAVVEATVELELAGAFAWGERHGIDLTWLQGQNRLRIVFRQPETSELFYLGGQFDDYRALPPAWQWFDKTWSQADRLHDSPKVAKSPFGSSMFIRHGNRAVICAPFNRLAHKDCDGPHPDWGGLTNWAVAGLSHVHATTIGDMLQAIRRDVCISRGRMA